MRGISGFLNRDRSLPANREMLKAMTAPRTPEFRSTPVSQPEPKPRHEGAMPWES